MPCYLNYPGIADKLLTDAEGREVAYEPVAPDLIRFDTRKGGTYRLDCSRLATVVIASRPAGGTFVVTRRGNTLHVEGKGFRRMEVADLSGRVLLTSKARKAKVDPAWGGVVLVSLQGEEVESKSRNGNQ